MPSTYAHYRMGKEVFDSLEGEISDIIRYNYQLYMIGLHGPDILFYHKLLKAGRVNRTGYDMHERPGIEFFRYAKKVIHKKKNKAPYIAYLYGVMCHFALDVSCHGYIDEKMESSGISHAEIEVEFDRRLMEMDGYDPVTHCLTRHIVPSMRNAKIISAFYRDISAEDVSEALKGMILYNRILLAPSKLKRYFILTLLKLAGKYENMHGLMVNYEPNPACEDSNRKLTELYEEAKKLAVSLIDEYAEGKAWNPVYKYTFGSELLEEGSKFESSFQTIY